MGEARLRRQQSYDRRVPGPTATLIPLPAKITPLTISCSGDVRHRRGCCSADAPIGVLVFSITSVVKAQLIERLLKLDAAKIQAAHLAALLAAGRKAEAVQARVNKARKAAKDDGEYFKSILVTQLVEANLGYVERNIKNWEQGS